MARRLAIALGIAMGLVLLLTVFSAQGNAFGTCYMSTDNSTTTTWTTFGYIGQVGYEERPPYMSVDWGDGSNSYQEAQGGAGDYSFALGHTYGGAGTYYGHWEIGTVGSGACISTELTVYVS
jgi:hypothetical protein